MSASIQKAVWVASLLAAGQVVVVAQPALTPPDAAAATNVLGPKIQFATPIYDFGRVRAGEPVKYTYVFTNTGDALLILNSVQPQCGCTAAGEWTRQVEPGKTGNIPIQFNTTGYNGQSLKQVTVQCNVTNQPTVFLQIKGTIYKAIDLNPPLAVLNVLPDTEKVSVMVTITNNTGEPLLLSPPESNNRMFATELATNTPGKSYQLKITTVPPLSMGSVQGQISLRTGWTNPPTLSVPVVANVQPAIVVVPSYITLAPGPLANALTNSVSIRNQSTNAVLLTEPTVNVQGVEAEIKEMQPGKAFAALVAFPQGFELPPGQQVELRVKTSHPRFPVLKVPIMQMPRPAVPPGPVAPAVRPAPPTVGNPPSRPAPPPLPSPAGR
ncbi:MAG TPA: DUF1573 domain-containing protein [Candidatus Paceibacterota bacterium]|nr:DUF1573 domain-containing protein [Verrucomicrobiota bacterium]HSA12434.1 DUF1573 domain-containing protein [Candidatus Paceibacterota bacterium]